MRLHVAGVSNATLPSCGVLRRRDHRYYDPLGLPLHRARLDLRPIRTAFSRRGMCRRISRVPCFSLDACCAPYPGEILNDRFGSLRRGHGLFAVTWSARLSRC